MIFLKFYLNLNDFICNLNKLHFSVSYIIVVEYGPATNRYFVLVLNYVDIVTSLIFINQ